MLPSAGPALGVPCLTCTEEPRTDPVLQVKPHQGWVELNHLSTCWQCSSDAPPPDTIVLLGHKGTTGSWTDCYSPGPTVPSPQSSIPAAQTISSFQQVIFLCSGLVGKKPGKPQPVINPQADTHLPALQVCCTLLLLSDFALQQKCCWWLRGLLCANKPAVLCDWHPLGTTAIKMKEYLFTFE